MRLFNKGYYNLLKDKKAWQQERAERKDLEGTLRDGLDAD